MRLVPYVALLVLAPVMVHASSASDRFWDPFRETGSALLGELTDLLESVLPNIVPFSDQPASVFRIPDPSRIGFRPFSAYQPGFVGVKTGQLPPIIGLNAPGVPPIPIADTPRSGAPCGGGDGDPYWADDCSCRCSNGGVQGLRYEVSDRCPENDGLACEECRSITRHDKHVTRVTECQSQFASDPGGGEPTSDDLAF